MTGLLVAIAAFLLTHLIPAYKPLRQALVGVMGVKVYLVLYSLLSLAMIGWLAHAYAAAPYVEVWPFADWTRWVPVLVMPLACVLVVAGLTSPNPFSLGAGSRGYDPARPGIVSVSRHPAIWGLVLWSGAHLVPNGDLASVLLFGLLTILGLLGPASLDLKTRARLGDADWARLAGPTSALPFAAILAGRTRLDGIGWKRGLGGLVLYAVLYGLHAPVIGVEPLVLP